MAIRTHTHIGDMQAPGSGGGRTGAHGSRPRPAKQRYSRARPPRRVKAAPVAFKTTSTLDDVIAAVVGSCRDHWQVNLPAALDGRDAEGVHQVRVGLRRFRSALSLFKAFVPENQRHWLNTEAKCLANQLGPARDLDVFLADIEKRSLKDAGAARTLAGAVRTAHAAARIAAVNALRGVHMRRFSARVEAWLDGHGWHTDDTALPDVGAFARETLNKRFRKIKDGAARADKLTVAERHELRIAVKKLRYGLEFLNPVLPEKRVARINTVLKGLQDSLGHLNDLDVAERTLALVTARAAPAERRLMKKAGDALKAAHRKAVAKAEPETRRLCHKLAKLPPFQSEVRRD